jgi:predicted naringenin-chalcone synthase
MTQNSENAHVESSCYLQAIGTAVPDKYLDKEHGADLLKQSCTNPRDAKLLQRVARLTGIEKRHLAALDYKFDGPVGEALYRQPSQQPRGPGMGERTAAFQKSSGPLVCRALGELPPESLAHIDTLVTASCTHASAPGLELPVLMHTPVPATVDRWNLGFMGCSAGLAAMRLIHQTAALRRRSLILACELSSLHFQYTDQIDQMTANLLFADGAAAAIISPERSAVRIVGCGCVGLPEVAGQMVWFADDHGLRLELSQDLPETLAAHLPLAVSRFLNTHGTSIGDVDHWIVHPGGPQILEAVEKCLALPADALAHSWSVFRNYGNMSSPTVFFIMKELFATSPSGQVLAMAFGPGLTVEMVLMHVNHTQA